MKKTKRNKKIWVHVAHSFEEAEEFDIRFWKRASVNERFETAWSMIGDYLKMRGEYVGEPRLQKSILNIKRI